MRTLTIAPGVTQIVLVPRQAINACLVDTVLVDAIGQPGDLLYLFAWIDT
jgi:hypothetical protein